MERLLLLRLRSVGCAAEAWLNGVPVLRTPAGGGAVSLPVHEYLLEGDNEVQLVVEPVVPGGRRVPRLTDAPMLASLRLLLPRRGQPGSEMSARSLCEIDWAAAAGDLVLPPVTERRLVALPVKLPRWRWLDALPIDDLSAAQPLVAEFVQNIAVSLARGDPEPFLGAARVRFEDLAVAYQQTLAELATRWRSRIEMLHATKALRPVLPALTDVVLRPCAGGRLLECLAPDGQPVLRTEAAADGSSHAWPIRVAVVEGRTHIVR
jgi:hypothetical protein